MQQWFAGPTPDMLANNIKWRVQGYPVPQTVYQEPDAVFHEFFPTLGSQFAEWGAVTEDIIEAADGERVTVLGHYEGKTKAGDSVTIKFIHVWTMRNRLITHVEAVADSATFAAALRGSGPFLNPAWTSLEAA